MTAVKRNGQAMMRMERKKKKDINLNQVHHIGGGPYKGILVNKQADSKYLSIWLVQMNVPLTVFLLS